MDPTAFRADLDRIPAALAELATAITDGELRWPDARPSRVLLTGMGSSYFAAAVIARRLRARGLDAVAERASAERTWPPGRDLLVVAISATGTSAETLAAVEPHSGVSRVVALTNVVDSPITRHADDVVEMLAGPESGGVACRTFRHTLGALLALETQLLGSTTSDTVDVGAALTRAAVANADLLSRVDMWRPAVLEALDSPDGAWFLAPLERLSSAQQGALMVREGPRRRADACETGDWSHVDVYLTKTLDYRAVVFTGSRWDGPAAEWMTNRATTAVAVGGSFPAARLQVGYPHHDDPLVAMLTETLVAELVAASWWGSKTDVVEAPPEVPSGPIQPLN